MVKTVGLAEITANTTHKKPAILFLLREVMVLENHHLRLKLQKSTT